MNQFIPVDLKNWIRSIKLRENQYLFPLYEIVVNGIQAIHEDGNKDGKIQILIKRDPFKQLNINGEVEKQSNIIGFEVTDNGVGFNNSNRKSFGLAYTGHKAQLGCKGIGRFLALAAFRSIDIDSIFIDQEAKKTFRRTFDFDSDRIISNEKVEEVGNIEKETTIKLNDYRDFLRKASHTNTIASNLLHHCLIYFITKSQPKITIYDEMIAEPLDLDVMFKDLFQIEDNEESLTIESENFELNFVKNYSKGIGSHKIHYCGDKREVKTEALSKFIPVLDRKISDESGDFYVSAYVKGDYLNRNLTPLRDEFIIPRNSSEKDAYNKVTFEEIGNLIAGKVKTQFSSELLKVSNNHRESYKEYIYKDGLEYRHLLSNEETLDQLKPSSSDKEKELELHRLNYELEVQQKARVSQFLNKKIENIKNSSDYKDLLTELLSEENDLGQSKLVNYMLHRKTVLKVLEKFIEIQSDGDFKYEADIHDIIFMRERTSTQISFNNHNLWILDERLAYSKYISSDKPLKETEFIESSSDNKPDLLIYDNKFTYGDPNSSVVIFEFKRPMRDYYKQDEKNLGNQIMKYVKDLVSGKIKDHKGRLTRITKDTPKFGYIICDYDKDIKEELEFNGYKKTPKGTLFKYEEGANIFIEVLDYNQLLEDVNLRHKAFFSSLGIAAI